MVELNILVVDDEINIRKTISYCLAEEGHLVIAVSSGLDALDEASRQCFDAVFLDLKLGTESGMDLIPKLLSTSPWLKIIMITAHASIESAVEAMKLGAADYVEKPFSAGKIRLIADRIQKIRSLELELASLREQAVFHEPENYFTSANPGMKRVLETVKTAASSEAVILLTGESGTGKSVLAKAVHQWSSRSLRPFSIVSCPAMPSELLESELFGHMRGAFTGAHKENPGRIAMCEGGTLFLDEIADMPVSTQAKLLQVIQDKTYQRVGDPVTRKADIRIIAATNANLEEKIHNGTFREDLYYRLNVISISIPPLREHKEDIIPLVRGFLSHFSSVNHKQITEIGQEAMDRLISYSWPGNIRELRNCIERAVILGSVTSINLDTLPLTGGVFTESRTPSPGDPVSLSQLEKIHISRVLARSGTIQEAAAILGIDQATLWRKRRTYHLN